MNHLIGQPQIGVGGLVDGGRKIIAVAGEGVIEPVVAVKHAGDAVEAKAVDVVFVEPEAAVGEQELEHFRLFIIEAERIPGAVFAAFAGIKILLAGAVETAETLDLVAHRVGVNQIHDHPQPHAVGGVDQPLELVRSAEA
ncbi:hypothetical protein SDC9_155574 [bioreactor metagenome]|uniref:Uncharacterized protein n=1 Tax=bioreactor metagenome TaxID=1076179 RepID=A0A645F435_9ZZZZ